VTHADVIIVPQAIYAAKEERKMYLYWPMIQMFTFFFCNDLILVFIGGDPLSMVDAHSCGNSISHLSRTTEYKPPDLLYS